MSTITLPNFRTTSDITARVRLKDGGLAIDWSGLADIKAWLYSDDQRAVAGRFAVSVDAEDTTVLVCDYSAQKPQYLGPNRIIVQAKYNGRTKTYDKPLCNLVRWTEGQEGETITIDDPEVDVEIVVEDVSSSILDNIIAAALDAAARAEAAAQEAEHMVDIHQGPPGPEGHSPYIGENGNWYEWDETAKEYKDTGQEAKGPKGDTPTWNDFTQEEQEEIIDGAADSLAENKLNGDDLAQSAVGKIQLADRTYNAQQPNGMGYVILRKNKTFAEQVAGTNTIYEIRDNFSLSNDFTMPSGSALFFNGGKVMGSALQGNNTILLGNVKIENPKGSFDSFRLSWCVASGYAKLKSVLSLDVHEVVFDEDITITSFSGTIPTDIPVINGENHKITINTDCVVSNESAIFIQCGATTIVKDITLDFANHNVACGIYSDAMTDFSISGVKVENIKSSLINSNWGISGVYIKAYSSINVNVHNIIVKEIGALGNGNQADSTGPVVGVGVLNVGLNSVINISDIIISHIYNYNSGGAEIVDDACGIYVSNLSTSTNDSQINMTNIHAENYGKRCLKLDARYAVIDGLYANQVNIGADGVVGFNTGDSSEMLSGGVSIKNARSYGDAGYLVSTSVDKTNVENCFFGNASTARSKAMLRFMNSSVGQVGYITNCTCENSMFVYSDSVGRSKVYVNEITIHSNTGSLGYLSGLKNTEVYINGYTFDGSVRTVINYLADSVGSRLHISGARIVCNQGYNALFNASFPLDFKLTDFVISGYFQGLCDLSSCLYAEVSNGFVEYLGNQNNLVTGIGTIKLSQGTAVVRNVAKKVASGVSYLYGSRISYTGDGTLEILIDETAAPFNTETKGKVYTKEAFVEMYNRDMTIPASVTGAKMKIYNPYTDVPICSEYAGGWRICNAVAVNSPADATAQITGYAAGSLLYCKSVTKMILSNGTDWVNIDGTPLV